MLRLWLPAFLLTVALTACGGSSGSTRTQTPAQTLAPAFDSGVAVVPVSHETGADIAYVGEDGSLWLMAADGSGAHEIYGSIQKNTGGYVYQPEWSPDGTKIAFTRVLFVIPPRKPTYSEVSTLVIIDTAGNVIAETPGGFLPHWSPDGTQIAFLDEFDGTTGAFTGRAAIMSVADGDVYVHFPAIYTFDAPRWSPDGSMLAYSGADGLHVVDLGDKTDRVVLPNKSGESRQFTFWSGDRRVTAFEPARAEFYGCGYCPIASWGGDYVTVGIEGDVVSRVTNNDCGRSPPDFVLHPQPLDGHAAWIEGTSQIAVLPLCDTGFTVHNLIGLDPPKRYPIDVTSLEWLDLSPDGRYMLGSALRSRLAKVSHFERFSQPVYVIDMTTGQSTQIASAGRDAVWRP